MRDGERRTSAVTRSNRETQVKVRVNLDGGGSASVRTGVRFLDHMLVSLSTHSLIDLQVRATGDLQHHLVEDVALTVGEAINRALGERLGIKRFGFSIVPMDDALVLSAVDLVKRPHASISLKLNRVMIEDAPREDLEHFFQSLVGSIGSTVHIKVLEGRNDHHKFEAAVKAFGLALRGAISADPQRRGRIPSSKGTA